MGLHGEAVEAFKEAIRLRPEWSEAYSGLGVAYNCSRRFDESVEALRRAIELTPGWAQPYVI
jgi:Flp pilus assembly protein TadD